MPRTHIDPTNGIFYPDVYAYEGEKYRERPDYGTWILEFNTREGDYGLLNNIAPHVLMKRFAQSCWSELCEIYGIPPLVLKTNTDGKPKLNVLHPGLEGNPGKTGEVFSDSAKYITKSGSILLDRNTATAFPNMDNLLSADTQTYRLDYYSDKGGFLQTNRERIKEGNKNKQEKEKFEKEHSMCMTLASGKHFVVYRESIQSKGNSYDIVLDGQPAELKKAKSANNIVDYAKKAVSQQGASIVVFEFENESKDIYLELSKLQKSGTHGIYFFSSRKHRLYEF